MLESPEAFLAALAAHVDGHEARKGIPPIPAKGLDTHACTVASLTVQRGGAVRCED